jgi:hypothetical protein
MLFVFILILIFIIKRGGKRGRPKIPRDNCHPKRPSLRPPSSLMMKMKITG